MHWIIQNNIYSEEGFDNLISTLDTLGLPYSVHKCVPFEGTLDPEPKPIDGKAIVMGSYTLALKAKQYGWTPGAFITEDLDYKKQLAHWGTAMFNHDAIFTTFGAVEPQKNPFFIRPVADTKSFTGFVVDWPYFENWRNGEIRHAKKYPDDVLNGRILSLDTEVMVCPNKRIYNEFRTWIVNGKAVAWSQYKVGTMQHYRENVDQRILSFAGEVAKIWSPAPAYVLDVFETENGLFIGEINNLNAAGFYKANMGKLIMALEEAFG
jgi:ATP-grasp domain, R2K clade family 3